MKKIITCIMICLVVVSNVSMVVDAVNNYFSITLTRDSPKYVQVPRSNNYASYVTVYIKSINGNSPIYFSVVNSSHNNVSNAVTVSSAGVYTLHFNRPIGDGAVIYVKFYSGYYSVDVSGYIE